MYNYQISKTHTVVDGGVAALLILLCCLRTCPFKQAGLRASDFLGSFILPLACSLLCTC